jgi:hypothetical protein
VGRSMSMKERKLRPNDPRRRWMGDLKSEFRGRTKTRSRVNFQDAVREVVERVP